MRLRERRSDAKQSGADDEGESPSDSEADREKSDNNVAVLSVVTQMEGVVMRLWQGGRTEGWCGTAARSRSPPGQAAGLHPPLRTLEERRGQWRCARNMPWLLSLHPKDLFILFFLSLTQWGPSTTSPTNAAKKKEKQVTRAQKWKIWMFFGLLIYMSLVSPHLLRMTEKIFLYHFYP